MFERAHGRDSRVVHAREIPQSISRETTFHRETGDRSEIEGMLYYLAERAMNALRDLGLTTGTVTDFMERGRVAPTELESLILAGAFDFTGMTRPELVLEARMMHGKIKRATRAELVGASAGRGGALFKRKDGPRDRMNLADFSIEQKVEYEFEILECPMSAHPVALARKGTVGKGWVRSEELSRYVGRGVMMMGILYASRGAHTVNGKVMQFLTIKEETGLFEITLFPEAYRKCRRMLTDVGPYVVDGLEEERYDSISVTASGVRRA